MQRVLYVAYIVKFYRHSALPSIFISFGNFQFFSVFFFHSDPFQPFPLRDPASNIQSRVYNLLYVSASLSRPFFFLVFFWQQQQTGHYSLKSVISFAEAGGLDDFAEAEGNSPRDAWFLGG